MEIIETNSEGANIHLSRYDLAILANALENISQHMPAAEIESKLGCDPIEVKRLLEKFSRVYESVVGS